MESSSQYLEKTRPLLLRRCTLLRHPHSFCCLQRMLTLPLQGILASPLDVVLESILGPSYLALFNRTADVFAALEHSHQVVLLNVARRRTRPRRSAFSEADDSAVSAPDSALFAQPGDPNGSCRRASAIARTCCPASTSRSSAAVRSFFSFSAFSR